MTEDLKLSFVFGVFAVLVSAVFASIFWYQSYRDIRVARQKAYSECLGVMESRRHLEGPRNDNTYTCSDVAP